MEKITAVQFADGLRQVADFIEAHPNIRLPWDQLICWYSERASFVAAVAAMAKGGKVTKNAETGEYADYIATREFGPIKLQARIPRKTICRLVSPAVYDCPDSLLEEAAEYAEAE